MVPGALIGLAWPQETGEQGLHGSWALEAARVGLLFKQSLSSYYSSEARGGSILRGVPRESRQEKKVVRGLGGGVWQET